MWVLLLGISIQAQTTTKEGNTITFSGYSAGDLATALADLAETDLSDVTKIVFSNCTLNADDFTAMSSTELSGVKTVDMSNATVSVDTSEGSTATAISTMSGMNLSGMEYLRLPNNMTSADDVEAMANLHSSSKNASLKMAGAYKDAALDEVALYSFESNNVQGFHNAMMSDVWSNIKVARLAGQYGVNDLDKGNNNLVFSSVPAEWDFTGANFDACTIEGPLVFANGSSYYREDDPFEEGQPNHSAPLSSLSNFQTNAFFYFQAYAKSVVKLTLPDQITELPPRCLDQLCKDNKENWKLYYGKSDDDFSAVALGSDSSGAPLENLVVPNSVVTVGYECAYNTNIKKISFGSGLKVVQGGAFKQVQGLEDIEFATGISNCYLGHDAFQLCYDVKHVVLTEGIVSLGAGCFQNSQQMESIRLPESLLYIGNRCFDNNLALSSITIPSHVRKIGQQAFTLTALKDVFLTTTDPAAIPEIFTAGKSWQDGRSTFGANQLYGNNGIPWSAESNHWTGATVTNEGQKINLTWDQAVTWYYGHASCMAVLHYPPELKDKVMASISATYNVESADGFGLPAKNPIGVNDESQNDMNKRADGNGLAKVDGGMGSYTKPTGEIVENINLGKFSQDGWVQFLLMKESKPNEGDRYTKNYKDVWYTMCFPFDLSDEQLATAFNEGFNIVDFSGIQIKDPAVEEDNVKKKTLVLHFNKVAETFYKDTEGRIYERKKDGNGNVIREKDGDFEYNVYIREGQEYHHKQVENATNMKTKTFSVTGSDVIVIIDGILASAGHPYMIHPNTGTVPTADPVPCHFSGIKWVVGDDEGVANGVEGAQTTDQVRAALYEAEKRTVDLGVANTSNNYDQKSYGQDYAGQTYTFIGNPKIYRDDAAALQVLENEPQIPEEPIEPVAPPMPTETISQPTETVAEPTALTADEQYLFSKMTDGNGPYEPGIWNGETEITANYNDGSEQYNKYASGRTDMFFPKLQELGYNPYGSDDDKAAAFNFSKSVFNRAKSYASDYAAYLANKALWDAYRANQAAWNDYYSWDDVKEQKLAEYRALKTAYDEAVTAHTQWEETASNYKVLIPQYAYFLGTAPGANYPKYWREIAPDDEPRSTGIWSQYAAVIIPNTAALKGLEKELGNTSTTSQAKSHPIAFDEEYFVLEDIPHGIATLIEKIEKEEGKADVEYMDIVVSIDGKIVSRDKTTFEGLPKGVYIINGKKYYVK